MPQRDILGAASLPGCPVPPPARLFNYSRIPANSSSPNKYCTLPIQQGLTLKSNGDFRLVIAGAAYAILSSAHATNPLLGIFSGCETQHSGRPHPWHTLVSTPAPCRKKSSLLLGAVPAALHCIRLNAGPTSWRILCGRRRGERCLPCGGTTPPWSGWPCLPSGNSWCNEASPVSPGRCLSGTTARPSSKPLGRTSLAMLRCEQDFLLLCTGFPSVSTIGQ